ncbi:MAG: MBOAT family O-acyltransferase, partial [Clostridia bacterium]|nr:MBOAT family O-acyltransferase [Clostridia bacterium]
MVFSSLEFIFFFFPIVTVFYMLVKNIRIRNGILIAASILFYAFGEPKAVILMLLSIVFNYGLAMLMEKYAGHKKIFLISAVIINIGLLFYYKYTGFFLESVNYVFKLNINIPVIHLPIGISFFTFQAMSYVIDVYRGETKAQRKLSNIVLYISFFPQLIAGPIVKYHDIEKQIEKREVNFTKYSMGLRRFLFGLFKKVLIANNAGALWSLISNMEFSYMSMATAWLGAVAFSIQIYFDFSGYSDMAIGLGKMFGFEFLENFNYPYISKSIREFWRRWHISLSTWFKEYLYIPLGGNRRGNFRTYINLIIVFFCTGMWHGASWNFVIWGMWHGLFSVIERLGFGKILEKDKSTVLSRIYTLFVVITGFTVFAITDFGELREYIKIMLFNGNGCIVDNNFIFMLKNNIFVLLAGIVFSTPVYGIIAHKESR